jgi:hypothetical protein
MSGMEVPLTMAGINALGGYLGGGRPQGTNVLGFGQPGGIQLDRGLHPESLFAGALGGLGRLGAAYSQYAATPVSMPSSYAANTFPIFKGAGPVTVGVYGTDPAVPRPELLTRPGVSWGDAPPFTAALPVPGEGADILSAVGRGATEFPAGAVSAPPLPTYGGALSGVPEMQKALSFLGANFDSLGNYVTNAPLPTLGPEPGPRSEIDPGRFVGGAFPTGGRRPRLLPPSGIARPRGGDIYDSTGPGGAVT